MLGLNYWSAKPKPINARPKQSVADARPYKSCKVAVKRATEHGGVYSTF